MSLVYYVIERNGKYVKINDEDRTTWVKNVENATQFTTSHFALQYIEEKNLKEPLRVKVGV